MPTYAVGQRLTAAILQALNDLIENSTESASLTSDSASITTTETTTLSLVVYLEAGKTYELTSYARMTTTVANDVAHCRIRLTSTAGSELGLSGIGIPTTNTNGFPAIVLTEYTAVSTGNQTFVHTVVRSSGSGNIQHRGASNQPGWLRCKLKG